MKILVLLAVMFAGIAMPVSLYLFSPTLGFMFCFIFGLFSFVAFSLADLLIVRRME